MFGCSRADGPGRKYIQFVIKASKLCNLRCRYCYEFESLANKEKMALADIERLFVNVLEGLRRMKVEDCEIHFVWHGGEPLVLPAGYLDAALDLEDRVFEGLAPAIARKNLLQTNLSVLDEDRLRLLRRFDHIGVSCDIVGGLRVDARGRDREMRTIGNMDVLLSRGIAFGVVAVLSGGNAARIDDVYDAFCDFGISFRLLPLHRGYSDEQHAGHGITTDEIITTFKRVYQRWMADARPIYIEPIFDHVRTALEWVHSAGPAKVFNKRGWINTLLINTDGECYGYPDPYQDKAFSYGNLFREPFSEFFAKDTYLRSCLEAEKRMAANCLACDFFGNCTGHHIAEDRNNERESWPDGVGKCVVERSVLTYIADDLRRRAPETVANPLFHAMLRGIERYGDAQRGLRDGPASEERRELAL